MKKSKLVSIVVLIIGITIMIGVPILAEGLTPTELRVDIISMPNSAKTGEAVAVGVELEVHGWVEIGTSGTANFNWDLHLGGVKVNSGVFSLGAGVTAKSVSFVIGSDVATGNHTVKIIVSYGTLSNSSSQSIYIEQVTTPPPPPPTYTLTTSGYPSGAGSVVPESGAYDKGTQVTITAYPNAGYKFSHWSGNASGTSNPVTLTMNANKNIIANFAVVVEYILTTSAVPTKGGSVNPSSGRYEQGKSVTVTAYPSESYVFDRWVGDGSGTSTSFTVIMESNRTLIAYFKENVKPTHELTTSISPSGAGYVNPSAGTFEEGKIVTLTATAYSGYEFDYWSGDAGILLPSEPSQPEILTVIMDSDKNVTANFTMVVPPPAKTDWLFYGGIALTAIGAVGLVATTKRR